MTQDATVTTLSDERKVVNFSVAVNETYKPKGGERMKVTTYYSCSYWRSEKVAAFLKKGTLLELTGRIKAKAFVSRDGLPKAAMNCHVSTIKFLARPREVEVIGRPVGATEAVLTPEAVTVYLPPGLKKSKKKKRKNRSAS